MPGIAELTSPDQGRWLLALAAASLVAIAGYRARALTRSGAVAAPGAGTVLVGAGGWWTGFLIVAFFVSSSALSRLARNRQPTVRAARGERRDAIQVIANGGPPVALVAIATLTSDPTPWLLATACGIAGACADTWATETGRTSPVPPRMITTGRIAPSGASGAVSVRGTLGALAGASWIALVAAIGIAAGWWLPGRDVLPLAVTIVGAGFVAALADSVLGATIQARYRCPLCDVPTEAATHDCGTPAALVQGRPVVTNDAVNALSIACAAMIGWLLAP